MYVRRVCTPPDGHMQQRLRTAAHRRAGHHMSRRLATAKLITPPPLQMTDTVGSYCVTACRRSCLSIWLCRDAAETALAEGQTGHSITAKLTTPPQQRTARVVVLRRDTWALLRQRLLRGNIGHSTTAKLITTPPSQRTAGVVVLRRDMRALLNGAC